MKNPFPGMNPYLEEHWPDVHASLVVYIRDQLQKELPPGLTARAEEQVTLAATSPSGLRPDVKVVEAPELREPMAAYAADLDGDREAPAAGPVIVLVDPEAQRWIQIKDAAGRLVTVIEVLSPSNKSEPSLADYRARQRAYLAGNINLVEIDLLRKGHHVLSVPASALPERIRTPYLVCVFRANQPGQREVYPVPLRRCLPAIHVPLRSTDSDVLLALQPLINQCFEGGGYGTLDYRRDPEPPLAPEDAAWADEMLRQAGLR